MTLEKQQKERLRIAAAVLADATPVGVEFDELTNTTLKRSEGRPRSSPFGIAAAIAVLFGVVATGLLIFNTEPAANLVTVESATADYEVEVPPDCDVLHQTFDSVLITVWGPEPVDGLFRVNLEYPDGTSEWFIVDDLVNTHERRVWSNSAGERFIGSGIPDPSCPTSIGEQGADTPNRFLDSALLRIALLVSGENLVTDNGQTFSDRLTEQQPSGTEVIDGVNTLVYSDTFNGIRSTIWFDEAASRVQKMSTQFADGGWSQTLTVIDRGTMSMEPDFFDTDNVPLYTFYQGLQ
jgi:hypothetical protein